MTYPDGLWLDVLREIDSEIAGQVERRVAKYYYGSDDPGVIRRTRAEMVQKGETPPPYFLPSRREMQAGNSQFGKIIVGMDVRYPNSVREGLWIGLGRSVLIVSDDDQVRERMFSLAGAEANMQGLNITTARPTQMERVYRNVVEGVGGQLVTVRDMLGAREQCEMIATLQTALQVGLSNQQIGLVAGVNNEGYARLMSDAWFVQYMWPDMLVLRDVLDIEAEGGQQGFDRLLAGFQVGTMVGEEKTQNYYWMLK